MFRNLRLGTRMLLQIELTVLVALGIMIGFVSIRSARVAREGGMKRADELAARYTAEIRNETSHAMGVAQSLAQTFEALRSAGGVDRDREQERLSSGSGLPVVR